MATFKDLTRDLKGLTYISEFEAQSAAILEDIQGIKIRGLRAGEAGDYAFESGTLGGRNVAGKTIDQVGIKREAANLFKMNELLESISGHFTKQGVDFILLDVRFLTAEQKEVIKNFLRYVPKKDLDRLITIGF